MIILYHMKWRMFETFSGMELIKVKIEIQNRLSSIQTSEGRLFMHSIKDSKTLRPGLAAKQKGQTLYQISNDLSLNSFKEDLAKIYSYKLLNYLSILHNYGICDMCLFLSILYDMVYHAKQLNIP